MSYQQSDTILLAALCIMFSACSAQLMQVLVLIYNFLLHQRMPSLCRLSGYALKYMLKLKFYGRNLEFGC